MKYLVIREDFCKSCELCIVFCPKGALSIAGHLNRHGFYPVQFDKTKGCTGCTNCAVMCPEAAIEIVDDEDGSESKPRAAAKHGSRT